MIADRIAAAAGDPTALLALCIELAQENALLRDEATKLETRRKLDRERKAVTRTHTEVRSVPQMSADVRGIPQTSVDSTPPSPALPSHPSPSSPPHPPNNPSLTLPSHPQPPVSGGLAAGAKRNRGARPAVEPADAPRTPAPWLDHLHRVWSEVAGVMPVPRFRAAIKPALDGGYTVGQIERAMRSWVAETLERGRMVKLEWFLETLSATVRGVDEGTALFVMQPADLGLTPEQAEMEKIAHRNRLRIDDDRLQKELLTGRPLVVEVGA